MAASANNYVSPPQVIPVSFNENLLLLRNSSYMPAVASLSLKHPPIARMESVSKRSHKLMKPALPYIPVLLKAMQDPWWV